VWLFSIKKKNKRSVRKKEPLELRQIIEREDIEKLHDNDDQLRFWLPEECKLALDKVLQCNHSTGARYLRELFVVYLYGEHELQRMRVHKTGLYYTPPPVSDAGGNESSIRYSRVATVDTVPGLGKNIIPVKLFLPNKIKIDLQKLADKAGIPLSTFVREILISHLLGHTLWQERLRSWSQEEEAIGMEWEIDDEEKCTVNVYQSDREKQGADKDPEILTYSW